MSKLIRMSQRLLSVPGSGIRDAPWIPLGTGSRGTRTDMGTFLFVLWGRISPKNVEENWVTFHFNPLHGFHANLHGLCNYANPHGKGSISHELIIKQQATSASKVMSKSAALKAAGKDVINWHIGTWLANYLARERPDRRC